MLLSSRYCRPPRPSSTSTTPAPPSQAELLNFADIPRPFKSLNPTTTSKARSNLPANRRNKTLKQILTTEREQAMGLVTEGKRKGKRPLSPKSALEAAKREEERKAAISEAGVHGAAAKTFRKRIQKEQRERARAAKQNKRKGGGDEVTPEVEIDDAEEDEAEGSGLLGEERSSETPMREETPTEQEKEEERLLQRKRRLPTCEFNVLITLASRF